MRQKKNNHKNSLTNLLLSQSGRNLYKFDIIIPSKRKAVYRNDTNDNPVTRRNLPADKEPGKEPWIIREWIFDFNSL